MKLYCVALLGALTVPLAVDAATHKKTKKTHNRKAATAHKVVLDANQPAPQRRVAVLELASLGMSEQIRHNLEMLLSNSIGTLPGVQLIAPLDVRMILQNPKNANLARCGGGPSCSLKIGQSSNADVVVFGTIAAIGNDFSLNLRALRVADGAEVGRQKAAITGNLDQLIPEIRLAAYRLLAPNAICGSLMVDTDVIDVEIRLDGSSVGRTPLQVPIQKIKVGEHVVQLLRTGYRVITQPINIKPFETTRLRLTLEKEAS